MSDFSFDTAKSSPCKNKGLFEFSYVRDIPDLQNNHTKHIRVAFSATPDTELEVPIPSGCHQVRITNESAGEIAIALDETPGDTAMSADTTPTEAEYQTGLIIRGGVGIQDVFVVAGGTNLHLKAETANAEAMIEFV